MGETDRNCSFCNRVLLEREITNLVDTETEDSPLLSLTTARSYVGAPLRTEDGYIIGTFGLLDDEPRQYSAVERDILKGLARVTMEQIDLRYDNTERGRLNQELQQEIQALYEKIEEQVVEQEELIHRTKNSFQQVKSILSLRKNKIEDPENYRALELAETKLHAFMTLYEQLTLSRGHDSVAIESYLGDLLTNLREVFDDGLKNVRTTTDFQDLSVNAGVAVKFGISLNELVTNVYQHVFLPEEGSQLNIDFLEEDGFYELTVDDDGSGLPESNDGGPIFGGGLNLVQDMVEHGGDGSVTYEDAQGATFTVRLPSRNSA